MFQQGHFDAILREKQDLRRQVFETRENIQELDAQINSLESSSSEQKYDDDPVSDKETRFIELQKWLKHLNESLYQNRLNGGSFSILLDKNRRTLEVSPEGLIAVTSTTYSLEPIAPPDTSKSPYIRMEIARPGDIEVITANLVDNENVFVLRVTEQIYYIENLLTMRPIEFSDNKRGIFMEWKIPKKKLVFASAEYEEIEETIGSILKRFNQKRIQVMYKMQDVWERKSVAFDKTNQEHENQLLNLWTTLNPESPLENRVSDQWKEIGFQGKDPATDFRGMGIMGLDCLFYMAQTYPENVKKMLPAHRAYPWAIAGINMLSTLLTDFLGLSSSTINQPPGADVWSKSLFVLMCYSDHPHPFEEVFCSLMILLDGVFVAQNAGYMQFPEAMDSTKRIANEILATRMTSSDQFRTRIEQRVMGLTSNVSTHDSPSPPSPSASSSSSSSSSQLVTSFSALMSPIEEDLLVASEDHSIAMNPS